MYLQTWQSQMFYILSMPFGVLAYGIMIHYIAAEIFEILAYAAVTIFQKPKLDWTVDQRELYEKWKVFILAFIFLLSATLLLGTIGIFTNGSYIHGVYHIINMMFTISCGDRLLPYAEYTHKTVATVMTFIVFTCMLILYTMLYSLFIMFRYNSWYEVIVVLFGEKDELTDAGTNDDMLEFDEWRNEKRLQEKNGDFYTGSPEHKQQQQDEQQNIIHYASSCTESTDSSIENRESQKRLEHMEPMKITKELRYIQHQQTEGSLLSNPPDIQITSPSPPCNKEMTDPFEHNTIISTENSDINQIDTNREKIIGRKES